MLRRALPPTSLAGSGASVRRARTQISEFACSGMSAVTAYPMLSPEPELPPHWRRRGRSAASRDATGSGRLKRRGFTAAAVIVVVAVARRQ